MEKRWEAELQIILEELTGFPGPLSHARDEEASGYFGWEVRRLLYYGPTKRRTGTPMRQSSFRFLHGAQALIPDDTP